MSEEVNKKELPFAYAEVVKLMKRELDDDKMIRERVKVEMNKFLGDILFKESTYPYTNIKRINQEKERILLHLDAIKADCDALSADVQKTLKLKDVVEEDSFADFSATEKEDEEE